MQLKHSVTAISSEIHQSDTSSSKDHSFQCNVAGWPSQSGKLLSICQLFAVLIIRNIDCLQSATILSHHSWSRLAQLVALFLEKSVHCKANLCILWRTENFHKKRLLAIKWVTWTTLVLITAPTSNRNNVYFPKQITLSCKKHRPREQLASSSSTMDF